MSSVMLESYSLLTREALAAGCAVITGDNPGPAEVVKDRVNGLVVARGDTEAFGDAMRRLITDRDLLAQLQPPPGSLPLRRLDDQLDNLLRHYTQLIERRRVALTAVATAAAAAVAAATHPGREPGADGGVGGRPGAGADPPGADRQRHHRRAAALPRVPGQGGPRVGRRACRRAHVPGRRGAPQGPQRRRGGALPGARHRAGAGPDRHDPARDRSRCRCCSTSTT